LNYLRIFPDDFEMPSPLLDDGIDLQRPYTAVAVVGDGGGWGARLSAFLTSPTAASIYRRHGLDACN
jgi:hypothetical protein